MSLHTLLKVEISELSIGERIQLSEDLWDSILEKQEELPLSPAQQQELEQRLENYQKNLQMLLVGKRFKNVYIEFNKSSLFA
jgi:putative addiction module component (TIGR02574 family)